MSREQILKRKFTKELCTHCYQFTYSLVPLHDRGNHHVCKDCFKDIPRCEICGVPEWDYREYLAEDENGYRYFCAKHENEAIKIGVRNNPETTIFVFTVVGKSYCTEPEDGQKVYRLIEKILKNSPKKIKLSFLSVKLLTSAFLHMAIGQLYKDFDNEVIKNALSVENIQPEDKNLLKKVIDNAKRKKENKKQERSHMLEFKSTNNGFIYKRRVLSSYSYYPLECHDRAKALLDTQNGWSERDRQLFYCGTWCAAFNCVDWINEQYPKRQIKIACGKGSFRYIIDYDDLEILYDEF